jgi:hypothetical protein
MTRGAAHELVIVVSKDPEEGHTCKQAMDQLREAVPGHPTLQAVRLDDDKGRELDAVSNELAAPDADALRAAAWSGDAAALANAFTYTLDQRQ